MTAVANASFPCQRCPSGVQRADPAPLWLRGVYLYGSYARGDYHNGSDVDVAIVLAGEVDISAELDRVGPIASDISLRYDLLLSVLPIPEQWWAQRQSPLLLNLRKEGVAL